MKLLLCLCVILNLLTEDMGKTLYAFEPITPQEVSLSHVTISLEEAIERVRESHPDLKLQELALERAHQEMRLATRAFFPDLDADYIASSAAGGFGLILAAARVLKPLLSLKTLVTERKIGKLLEEKEKVLVRVRALEVGHGVKELYAALLIQERLVTALQGNLLLAQKRYRLKVIYHRAGRFTNEELFREKLIFEKARLELDQVRVLLRQSEASFRILLGLPDGVSFSLVMPEARHGEFPLSLQNCFLLARERSPNLQSLRLLEAASRKERDKTKSRFVVDGLFIGLGESGDLFQGRTRLGIQGNLTIYDWGKKGIRNQLRDLNHESLLLHHQKEIEALASLIVKDYLELVLSKSETQTLQSELRLAGEKRRRTRILYRAGRRGQEEILETEGEYQKLRARVFGNQLEYFLKQERLLKDLGLSGAGELKEVLGW